MAGSAFNPNAGITYPVSSVAGRTGTIILSSSDVGLSNVDNTADIDKPVSAAMQIELNELKTSIISGGF